MTSTRDRCVGNKKKIAAAEEDAKKGFIYLNWKTEWIHTYH